MTNVLNSITDDEDELENNSISTNKNLKSAETISAPESLRVLTPSTKSNHTNTPNCSKSTNGDEINDQSNLVNFVPKSVDEYIKATFGKIILY